MSQNQSAARTPHTRMARLKSLTAKAALTAAGLIAGSAGVAAAAPSSPAAPAAAATTGTVTLNLDGTIFTFAKFGGMTYDETLPQPAPGIHHTGPNVIRPTISLGDPLFTTTGAAAYRFAMNWERVERDGVPSARRTVAIQLNNAAGVHIESWVLENAVPINVDVAGGDPQSPSFTVVLTGDDLLLQA